MSESEPEDQLSLSVRVVDAVQDALSLINGFNVPFDETIYHARLVEINATFNPEPPAPAGLMGTSPTGYTQLRRADVCIVRLRQWLEDGRAAGRVQFNTVSDHDMTLLGETMEEVHALVVEVVNYPLNDRVRDGITYAWTLLRTINAPFDETPGPATYYDRMHEIYNAFDAGDPLGVLGQSMLAEARECIFRLLVWLNAPAANAGGADVVDPLTNVTDDDRRFLRIALADLDTLIMMTSNKRRVLGHVAQLHAKAARRDDDEDPERRVSPKKRRKPAAGGAGGAGAGVVLRPRHRNWEFR